MQHEMIAGGHGHGLSHCKHCLATDREIALALGPVCPVARPAPPMADETPRAMYSHRGDGLPTQYVDAPMAGELVERMNRQCAEWDKEEPRDDWWNYQRDYAEAATEITRLTEEVAAQVREIEGLADQYQRIASEIVGDSEFDEAQRLAFKEAERLARALTGGPHD